MKSTKISKESAIKTHVRKSDLMLDLNVHGGDELRPPYGSIMPGRQHCSKSYRYGFNGKEIDIETNSRKNHYDYGFRIYNSDLGRFLSVDPLTKSYPFYTPYQFAGNDVIRNIDLDGKEPKSVVSFNPKTGEYHFTKPAIKLLSLVSGVSEQQIQAVKLVHNSDYPLSVFRPFYQVNPDGTGGGAMTDFEKIKYTDNYFKEGSGDSAKTDHQIPRQTDHLIPEQTDHLIPGQTDHLIPGQTERHIAILKIGFVGSCFERLNMPVKTTLWPTHQ